MYVRFWREPRGNLSVKAGKAPRRLPHPALYGKELVTVQNRKGEKFTVMAYVMTDLYRREPVIPSPSYFCTIKDGFRQNGLLLRPLNRALKHCQEEVQAMYDINFDTIKKISCPPKKSNGVKSRG